MRPGSLGFVFGIACLAACGEGTEARMNAMVASIRDRTVPPGGELKTASPPESTAKGALSSTWEVEATSSWPEYRKLMLERLRPQYSLTSESETEMLLHRQTAGDTYSVKFVLISAGPPKRIRITFQAYPS